MRHIAWFVLCSALFAGCRFSDKRTDAADVEVSPFVIQYAKGFQVNRTGDYTKISIRNPWDTLKTLHDYILVDKSKPLPENLPKGTVVRTPVQRVVVYTSVHCGLLAELGIKKQIVGVCEPQYIDLDFIKKGLSEGSISDLGMASNPDVEQIIEIAPEVILASPFENSGYGQVEKTGIPLIECADYMESTPLGRAEWIRLHALFYGKEAYADSLFGEIVKSYNTIKELAAGVKDKPTVLTDMKYGSVWYVPGGQSYMAHFFRDAGADFFRKDNPQTGSSPLSVEAVFDEAHGADFWLIKYNRKSDITYETLKKEDSFYGEFAAFKNRNIFVCNTADASYYEELPIHPDYLLKDLVWIFHPELMPDYEPHYYKKMKE